MSFPFSFNTINNDPITVTVALHKPLFVVGANGSGKSALFAHIGRGNRGKLCRIAAHRPITLDSSAVSLTGQQREGVEKHIDVQESQVDFRFKPTTGQNPINAALYDLQQRENSHTREQYRILMQYPPEHEKHKEIWTSVTQSKTPMQTLENIMNVAGFGLSFNIDEQGFIKAGRDGIEPYGIQELSDGERAAFLLCVQVMMAPNDRVILIDEPERHLHKSISSPLISALMQERSDSVFIVSTHDIDLVRDFPDAPALLLRQYQHSPQAWDADYFERLDTVDEEMKVSVLGARRKILFVEGKSNSLDQALYSILFPEVSVRPKNNCAEVISTTNGLRSAFAEHHVQAFGLIDRDRRFDDEIENLAKQNVYALSVHSVESLYYHPRMIRHVAETLEMTGFEISADFDASVNDIFVKAFRAKADEVVADAIARRLRHMVLTSLPTSLDIRESTFGSIDISRQTISNMIERERDELNTLIEAKNAERMCVEFSVKNTSVPSSIHNFLGIKKASNYQGIVRALASRREDVAHFLRELTGIDKTLFD